MPVPQDDAMTGLSQLLSDRILRQQATPVGPETSVLTPEDELRFRLWALVNNVKDVDHPDSHYDYRGFWNDKEALAKWKPGSHFPDPYKRHGHPSFSVESQYSRGLQDGGQWIDDTLIRPPFPSH